MLSFNKSILIGYLGRDPELRYTSSGKAICSFSIATTEKWRGEDGEKEQTIWHNIVIWGKSGEIAKEYLSKGDPVLIEGRIVNRSYDDKDGKKKYISEVVAQSFHFLKGKGDSDSTQSTPPQNNDSEDLPF